MSSLASNSQDFYTPELEIIIDGKNINSSLLYISHLEVDLSSEVASLFNMRVQNAINEKLESIKPWMFKLGSSIKIRAGYQSNLEDIMDGIITTVNYNYGDEGHLSIDIEGCDVLFLLMKQYQQRSFAQMSDSDVATEVIAAYGLEYDIDDTKVIYNHIQQDHESDFTFLTRLAKRNGFEFYTQGETICFKAPALEKSPLETFTYALTPIELKCRHDITHQFNTVQTHGWDRLNREAIQEESSIADVASVDQHWEDASTALKRLGISDAIYPLTGNYENSESAQREADAMMQQFAYTLVKASGSIKGLASLKPANTIKLKGFSSIHNSNYYLTHVIHRIGEEGFSSYFEMKGNRIHESL